MDDKKSTKQIPTMMEEWFKKLPPLPANAVETIFKITPILALVFGILGVVLSISGLGVLAFIAPLAAIGGATPQFGLGIIATLGWLASSIMMILAYPGLKAGKISGWTMLFWSEMVSVVTAVLGISFGSVIGALIGFYILFQIKSKFK